MAILAHTFLDSFFFFDAVLDGVFPVLFRVTPEFGPDFVHPIPPKGIEYQEEDNY